MAAVHQRTPTPVDPKRRTAFIESMEEEIRRAAEHLEKRHRRRAPRLEMMNGYSFSEGSGSEAGARRRRVNKYPRQLPEGEPNYISESYSPPNSAPPLPITQKLPGGRNSATLPARPSTVHELFGFEEEVSDGEVVAGKESSPPVISPVVETLVMPASAPLPSISQTQQTLVTSNNQPSLPSNASATTEPANCNETSESPLPSPIQTTKTLFSPPPAPPTKEKSKTPERTTTRPITKSSMRRSLDSRIPQQVRGPEASNDIAATSDQAADLEVKSVPLMTGKHHRSVSLDKPPMTKEEHRHTTVARHEFRSKTDSKIHITVSSSVDKSRQRQSSREEQIPVLVKDLQSQLKEKEEEIRELQRKHGRELKEKVEQIKKLNKDTNRIEREKWELLKRARDAAERSLHLRTQLDMKEGSFRAAQIELERTRDELVSVKSANTSLRALLNDLRAPKSSIDVGIQVDLASTLRRNPSIELAMTQGLSEDIDSGFERSSDFRTSTSTLGETDRFERTPSVNSSLQDVRDTTPVVTPTQEMKSRRRKPGLFGKMRRSSGKRGSTPSVDGIDMSQSSIIHGARGATPISFPYSSVSPDMMDHWRVLEEFQSFPFAQWNLKAIVAWMEAGIGMGQYAAAIRERVTSGHAMLALTDSDMEKRLGILNPLHRRKFRLAIEYQRNPELSQFPLAGKIDHSWVAFEWSTDCGLPHLMETLMANLVDGRVLHSLTKEDLKRHLKIIKKSEQLSFLSGVELLRMHDFNRETIQDHRRTSRNPLYWTNRDVSDWLKDIHLQDNSKYVLGTGVHGALLFLERGHFTSEHLANLLHIPHSKSQVRRHLANKMAELFSGDVTTSSAHSPQQRLLHFSSERRPPTHLSQPSPEHFRSPSVPIPLLDPHPTHVNSLSSLPPAFKRRTSSPGFYRTSSNPSLPPEMSVHQQRIQDRARLSLRESALRCVAIHEETPLMHSLTPTTLTGTTV